MIVLLRFLLILLVLELWSQQTWAQGLKVLTTEERELVKELNRPRRIILAIGINSFEDPFWNSLQFADADAGHVFRFLRNEANLPFDAGELITTSNTKDGRVSREHILKAFERLKKLNVREDDTVVVYLSTHGTIYLRKNKRLDAPSSYVPYFVASDTSHLDIQNTAISRDELIEIFQSLRSERKALIIASCHSGGGKAQLTPEIQEAIKRLKGQADPLLAPAAGRGFSILSASSWSEPAAEDKKLQQDIYTHFLVESMRKNMGRALTLTQAHDDATRHTIAYTNKLQHPTMQMDQSGGDPIVLSGEVASQGLAFLYSYVNTLKNYELRVGGQSKGILGDSYLAMPEGKHRLEIIDPETDSVVVSRVIRLTAGKEYSVSDLIQKSKSRHVMLGLGQGRFFNQALRATLTPNATPFSSLHVRLDEAFGIWDLVLSGGYNPGQQETIRMGQQPFSQRRSTAQLILGLGSREPNPFFRMNESVKSEWGFYGGPALVWLKRRIEGDNRIAITDADTDITLPGLGLGTSLNFQHIESGLEFGLAAQYDIYWNQNQIETMGRLASQAHMSAFLGVGW
ncbi:MAG TPA: caspase family protein [Oligoflexus sp.]|uniref:caspase family protein n=1 Tax=Oligoflexus sp. TaxID=1971216 RepID=UPI002D28B52E|nr:caspase family protein [Oligoflexus sp.]HYX33169.1 caspase family protein [Oligoflexus sp.]